MTDLNTNDSTVENASDITISVGTVNGGVEIAVDQLSTNEDIEYTKRYGSGNNDPTGRSMGHKDYGGSFTVLGLGKSKLNSFLFNSDGDPKEFTITITHADDSYTNIKQCAVENRGFEVNDGEMVETSYDFDAMGIEHAHQSDGSTVGSDV